MTIDKKGADFFLDTNIWIVICDSPMLALQIRNLCNQDEIRLWVSPSLVFELAKDPNWGPKNIQVLDSIKHFRFADQISVLGHGTLDSATLSSEFCQSVYQNNLGAKFRSKNNIYDAIHAANSSEIRSIFVSNDKRVGKSESLAEVKKLDLQGFLNLIGLNFFQN